MPIQAPTLIENYLGNAEYILDHAKEYGNFTKREKGTRKYHQAKPGGPISKFSSWFIHVEDKFADVIFETIPQDRKHCTQLVLNRYQPGDYLVKHCDAQGLYWKFKLVYLTMIGEHEPTKYSLCLLYE